VYTKNDGTSASSFEITAQRVRILKGKDGAVAEGTAETNGAYQPADDEDIPF
jgi:hypothetical protein